MRTRYGAKRPGAMRRGGALLMALIATGAVAVLGATTMQLNRSAMQREAYAQDLKEAFYLAEGGLAEAFLALRQGKSGKLGAEEDPARFGGGLLWVEVIDHGLGRYELVCTAMSGTAQAKLAMLAQRNLIDPGIAGVFSRSDVTVGAGTLIDGYDSRAGSYEDQADMTLARPHTPGGGRLGSNGEVRIEGTPTLPTEVWGDVAPGPTSALSTASDVTISGQTAGADEEAVIPPATYPDLPSLPALRHDLPQPLLLPPGRVGYDALSVAAGAELVVHGPALLVVGSLTLEDGAALTFETTDGPIELVVTQFMDLRAGSQIATSGQDTSDVTIAVAALEAEASDPLVRLHAEGRFFGSLYAPQARVQISSPFEFFGGLAADGLELGANATFHTDRAFMAGEPGNEPLPSLDNWRIVDLSRLPGGGVDPYRFMNVDPVTASPPAEAHDLSNVCLHLDYRDAVAVKQKYHGWEDEFDWGLVSEVLKIKRHEKER